MHANIILLIASLAATVIAAPMPNASPNESPVMVRAVEQDSVVPAVENLKREILDRLDAIVQRSIPDDDLLDANEKRRLASGVVPPGLNARDEEKQDHLEMRASSQAWQKRRVWDNSGLNKRRVWDNSGLNKRRVWDNSGLNKRRVWDNSGLNKRDVEDEDIDEADIDEVEKRRVWDNSGLNKRRVWDNSGLNKRRVWDNSGLNKRDVDNEDIDEADIDEVEKRRVWDNSGLNKRRVYDTEYTASEVDDE